VALFVDGCFWHCCPEHGSTPQSNTAYWGPKLRRNVERDVETDLRLKAEGWLPVRVWEHEAPPKAVRKVQREIAKRRRYLGQIGEGGSVEQPAKASAIRDAFFEVASRSPNNEVAYRDLFADLLSRGWIIRGTSVKRQQDAVYGALNADPRIRKVRPGVFAPA
jgi:hypothetical protein